MVTIEKTFFLIDDFCVLNKLENNGYLKSNGKKRR